MNNTLIIFAREPKLGEGKTRLQKDLDQQVVLDLYTAFVQDILELAIAVDCHQRYIYYASSDESTPFLQKYASDFQLKPQSGKDLGERMYNAFCEAQQKGSEQTIIIGTDCLTMDAELITAAFTALNNHDVVLGPSEDGGYYLIGLKQADQKLFDDIPWSSEHVLPQTLKQAQDLGLSVHQLNPHEDVDTLNSLRKVSKKVVNSPHAAYTKEVLKKYNLTVNP